MINLSAFFAAIRADKRLALKTLTQTQVDVLNGIIAAGVGLRRDALAYVLATAYHEAKLTPRREDMYYTTAKRLRAVWPSRFKTDADARPYLRAPEKLANFVYGSRADLGNRPGTSDGWVYRGGGLDQLTGRTNYQRVGIADAPEKILQPAAAVSSLVTGMTLGRYRDKKLADYFTAAASDFLGARAIINADTKTVGPVVVPYALAFRDALAAAGYPADGDVAPTASPPSVVVVTPPAQQTVSPGVIPWVGAGIAAAIFIAYKIFGG